MKSIFKKQRGIALLMVLAAIVLLTTTVVDFSISQRVSERVASNLRNRVQAYYLARSSLNFSKAILRYNKEYVKRFPDKEPAYKQILKIFSSTTALRNMQDMAGGNSNPEKTPDGEIVDSTQDPASLDYEFKMPTGTAMTEALKTFLDFDGDFSIEINEEQQKFDLNGIASMEVGSKAYDLRRKILLAILMQPEFKDLFENQEQDARKLVFALGDWVDKNSTINEFDKRETGQESSRYSDYSVKNGKMMTLSEMRLVDGMNDAIYDKLLKYVTIYAGNDKNKVNVCPDNTVMLKALIYFFTHEAGCTTPVEYEQEDQMNTLMNAVLGACIGATPDSLQSALYVELGLQEASTATDESESTTTTTTSSSSTSCSFKFKDLLTTDNSLFKIKTTGTVGDTEVSITTVVNTVANDATQWKYYYYHVD